MCKLATASAVRRLRRHEEACKPPHATGSSPVETLRIYCSAERRQRCHEETFNALSLALVRPPESFYVGPINFDQLTVRSALSAPTFTSDFFLSRRGSVAPTAREVADVLRDEGYNVIVQDYDFRFGASFVEAMHDAIKGSRDLVVLFTADYEKSPFTRKEFTSFEADRAQSPDERYIIVLRCEDVPLRGLFADNIYQDLVGVIDASERRERILAAARHQAPALPSTPRPFMGVPPRIMGFAGRTDALDQLDAILVQEKPAAVTQVRFAAVQGMGGVGKTSLAIEYAHRFRALHSGVCWCPAETRTGLLTSLAGLAVVLGAAAADTADVARAAKAALQRLAERRAMWLLVYDNVTSPEEIADLLPSAGARVLITSRFPDWRGWAEEVSLDVLPLAEAIQLLQRRSDRTDEIGGKLLAEALGCLPLALDHAAATCRRTQMPFAEYATLATTQIASVPRGAMYPRSVAVTFDLAIAEAAAQCPSCEALIAFFALCAPERIPMTLVEGAVGDPLQRSVALAALIEISLTKHDPFEDGTPAVTVHRLVQAVARVRSEAKRLGPALVDRAVERLLAIYPNDGFGDTRSWSTSSQLTPHVLALWRQVPERVSAELLRRVGNYLHWRASYAQAKPLLAEALARYEQAQHADPAQLAIYLIDLAGLLWDQGDLAGARPLFERALRINEDKFGSEDAATARTLNNLGGLLRDQGDLVGARPLLERALAIREKVFGPNDAATATGLTGLGLLLQAQGDLVQARQLLERAREIRETQLGPDHPNTAHSVNNLAEVLTRLNDFDAALPLFKNAILAFERTLGHDHPNSNRVRCNLARLLLRTGKIEEGLSLAHIALASHDECLGGDHGWTKDSASVVAAALDALNRSEEAKALRAHYFAP
jgi:tetratricopeptide (TPR) repeat protein